MKLAHTMVGLRMDRGMTQHAVGKLAGVSHSTIAHIEEGGDPKVSTLYAIADALEIAPTVLMPPLNKDQAKREAERVATTLSDALVEVMVTPSPDRSPT